MHNPSSSGTEKNGSFSALIPFLVFLVFYLGISLWSGSFYSVPMPVAFLAACGTAFLMNRKEPLNSKMELFAKGMGESNIMIMCMIFILAGAFASAAKAMGAVDATVLICRHGIPPHMLPGGFFLISCLISLAIGTSCGTIAAVMPIAVSLIQSLGISPFLMTGAVIGGAMFGHNMSMISDTTIAATRTQNVSMRDKFLMNLKMIFPAALLCLVLYYFLGRNSVAGNLPALEKITFKHILMVIPYLAVLAGAVLSVNVMVLLFSGTVLSIGIGCFAGTLTFTQGLVEMGKGIAGMSETLIVALLAGGLLQIIRHNGGIIYLLEKICKSIRGKRSCETGILLLVGAVNLFTANNTVAIVIAGPVAKLLSERYNCDPRRVASILDTASCVTQGFLPYGAQILIAVGIAKGANLDLPAGKLIFSLYYPILLGICLLLSILMQKKSTSSGEIKA